MLRLSVGLVTILCLLVVAAASARADAFRVLTIGDSITHGICCNQPHDLTASGYRLALREQLVASGYAVDMVGSLWSGPAGSDGDHEGHDGWATWELREYAAAWTLAAQPDAVLLMAGTNDLARAAWPPGAINEASRGVGHLVDLIADAAPDATIYVGQIPPIDFKEPYWTEVVESFNGRTAAIVSERQAAGRRVVWVSMPWQLSLISDRVHPNADGYAMMAERWHTAILLAQGQQTQEPPLLGRRERFAARELLAERAPLLTRLLLGVSR